MNASYFIGSLSTSRIEYEVVWGHLLPLPLPLLLALKRLKASQSVSKRAKLEQAKGLIVRSWLSEHYSEQSAVLLESLLANTSFELSVFLALHNRITRHVKATLKLPHLTAPNK